MNTSKGCAFLTYVTRSAAFACMEALHDKHVLPGMSHSLQIKQADSEQKAEGERKLFVGMISKTLTDEQLHSMFSPYGAVEEVAILQQNGVSKGCAFVKMDSRANAQRAIDGIHGRITMEGCRSPIVVKYADTDKEKMQKRGGTVMPQYPFVPPYMNPMMMYQQMANMGAPPGMGGPGMGAPGMGMMGAPNMGMGAPGMGMGAPAYDMSQAYAGMGQFAASGYGQTPYQQSNFSGATRPKEGGESGPDGANLFIYHLPPEFNDAALTATFAPFGHVVSSKVFVDKITNLSKGFGFVSYDSPVSAQQAIMAMNGFQIGQKRLKVEIKRPRGANAPY